MDPFLTLENRHTGEILRKGRVRDAQGQIRMTIDGSLDSRRIGGFPAGVVHCWWNAGDCRLELSGQVSPGVDLDRYLQPMFAMVNAGPSGRPSIFYLARVLWRHRHTQALAMHPRAIQRIVLPAVLLVGRILGKYRGALGRAAMRLWRSGLLEGCSVTLSNRRDRWPGSPASCPGAPEVKAAGAPAL